MANKNIYRTTVYVGKVNGKEIRKTVRAKTKRELNEKVRKIKNEIDNGKDVITKGYFGVWADKWLNEVKIGSVSNGTLTQYKSAIKHLNKQYEYVKLKDIKLSDFNIFIKKLSKENPTTGKPMSKRSLENIKKVARAIFKYAISNDISGVKDFFDSVTISKTAPVKERRALTEQEQQWIIDTAHRAQLPAMIMMFSGLRRGEVIPLQWTDIDFNKKTLSVNKSVEFISNQPIIKKGGKSASATRLVPLPQILIDYLNEYLKEYKANNKVIPNTICLNNDGNMYTKTSWKRMWENYLSVLNQKYGYKKEALEEYKKRLKKKNKGKKRKEKDVLPMRIEPFTAHYLRHTFATMLYLENINVVTAKQILGHAKIQTTVDIYTDLEHFNKSTLSDEYKERLNNEYLISA